MCAILKRFDKQMKLNMFKVSFKRRNDIDKVSRKISICNFASNKTCTYHVILRFKSTCSRFKRKKDIF